MIHVKFDPATLTGDELTWWTEWKGRSDKATAALIQRVKEGKAPEFNERIWLDLRTWLFEHAFNDKCAYCEAFVTDVSPGDAEHYRPKGKVTVGEETDNSDTGHPGYYWLAYHWKNLVPACSDCNTKGKGNKFPIEVRPHLDDPALDPDALDAAEKPKLLHPYRKAQDPRKLLAFDSNGVVQPRDPRDETAKSTIRVFRLGRDKLQTERHEAIDAALTKWHAVWSSGDAAKIDEFMKKVRKRPFAAAIIDAIVWDVERQKQLARTIADD